MSKASDLQTIYDAVVDAVDAILASISLSSVTVRRGFPRMRPESLQVPSTYLFLYGVDPATESQALGQSVDKIKLSLTVFLRDELELIKFIGTFLASPLNGGFINSGKNNVEYSDGERVSAQQLPEAADFGFAFSLTVLL